jgi:hypothetical protein
MPLSIPRYLSEANIQSRDIRYFWDDWNVEAVDEPLREELQERLHSISQRAVAALTIGIAEWIVFRFGLVSSDDRPAMRLEAAWAQLASERYSLHRDIDLNEWRGPVRGPIGIALRRAIFAIREAEANGEPSWRADSASRIAEHVLPDAAPFLKWRDAVLDRFEALYPIDADETLGEVVPREALDPENAFDPNSTEYQVNAFLSSLDHRRNPYLASPDQMVKAGFLGVPYTFDIKQDHAARYLW